MIKSKRRCQFSAHDLFL